MYVLHALASIDKLCSPARGAEPEAGHHQQSSGLREELAANSCAKYTSTLSVCGTIIHASGRCRATAHPGTHSSPQGPAILTHVIMSHAAQVIHLMAERGVQYASESKPVVIVPITCQKLTIGPNKLWFGPCLLLHSVVSVWSRCAYSHGG